MYRRIFAAVFCAMLLGGSMSCLAGCPEYLSEKKPLQTGKVIAITPLWTDKLSILSEQTGELSRIYHIEKLDPSIRYFTFNQAMADISVLPKEGVEVTCDANTFLPLYTVSFESSVEIEITFSDASSMARGDRRMMSLPFYDQQGAEVTQAQFGVTKVGEQYLFI